MSYAIEVAESFERGLRRIAGEQVEHVLEETENPGDIVAAVHDIRKRCKKLRALLRLYRGTLGPIYKQENRFVRDTARLLSDARDNHVVRETFLRFAREMGLSGATVDMVRRHLPPVCDDVPPEGVFEQIHARFLDLKGRIGTWRVCEPRHPFTTVETGLGKTYRRCRRALRRVGENPSPENLHEFRKRVKYHWYHVRLLTPLWDPVLTQRQAQIKQLSDYLGEDHDLSVLAEKLSTPDALNTRVTSSGCEPTSASAAGSAPGAGSASADNSPSASAQDSREAEDLPESDREFRRLFTEIDAARLRLEQDALNLAPRVFADPTKRFRKHMRRLYKSHQRSARLRTKTRARFVSTAPSG